GWPFREPRRGIIWRGRRTRGSGRRLRASARASGDRAARASLYTRPPCPARGRRPDVYPRPGRQQSGGCRPEPDLSRPSMGDAAMMRAITRFFLRRVLAVLSRIGRIEPVSIPPEEVVSATRLMEENRERLRELLESLGSEVLYEDRSAFGSTFFVERSAVGLVMRAIEDLQKDNYGVDV